MRPIDCFLQKKRLFYQRKGTHFILGMFELLEEDPLFFFHFN